MGISFDEEEDEEDEDLEDARERVAPVNRLPTTSARDVVRLWARGRIRAGRRARRARRL